MKADFEDSIKILKVDGGATANQFLMQFQADISSIPVLMPEISEITALGAAYFAGLYCGFWNSTEEIEKNWKIKKRYEPALSKTERDKKLGHWHQAVKATREYK
jgi:glycerol kinase